MDLQKVLKNHKQWLETYSTKGESADLRGANLRGANLRGAVLRGANLSDADLRYCIGNLREIRSMQIDCYSISYTKDILSIGCQSHTLSKWITFNDEEIDSMATDALNFWKKWKEIIIKTIELSFSE